MPELRRVVGIADGIGLSISSMAPTFTIGVGLGVTAAIVGPAMPGIWILAILPMLGIAAGLARLNARDANLGSVYHWAGVHLSPWLGFVSAWITVSGSILLLSYTIRVTGDSTLQTLASAGVVPDQLVANVPVSTVIGVLWLALLCFFAVRGVDLAARFQTVLIIVDVIAVVGICGLALLHGGGETFSLSWFNPFAISVGAIVHGVVITIYLYWGWDNSLRLNEESRRTSSAGRAAIWSLALILVVFLFAQIGFQRATTIPELVQHGATGLTFVAGRVAGRPGEFVAALALLISVLAIAQAILLATSRQTLGMSRDQVLGMVWGRIHPRWGTPAVGTLLVGGIATVICVLSAALGNLSQIITAFVTAIGMPVCLYYAIAGLAVVAAFRRERGSLTDQLVVRWLPLLSAIVLFAMAVYLFVYNWITADGFAFTATNTRFQDVVALVVLAGGIPIALARRRVAYFRRTPALEDAA
ncbi:APC family permease [Fodinicola acaciae]|uniref:APC family permease n=1 Tax=Fodinicola acaciae TaxID=2681555 RepID=UPI0013D1CC62|nr:APC family permease [Fodinicola acaciae]